ncbi:MAG: N-acetyltransferase family protein [Pseudomonadota bacterium]
MTTLTLRPATAADLPRLTEIYNHYVRETHSTFDTREFSVAQRQAWFDRFNDRGPHRLLVGCDANGAVGYASSQPLRPKPAYDRSVETTVYLAPECTGMGYGRRLYEALLETLRALGDVHRAYGVIALPNEASVRLHESLGFRHCATLNEVGFKFGRYWDTAWFELPFDDATDAS